ncbi:MAG: 2-isopropylmalate synthase [Firmicutes bacterium]|nr:2-isopropylmalate synthase [Bacillota bacterium]
MRKLHVFDTTLRDGEQSLPGTLRPEVKLEIARQLVRLGVDVIEAGFPASSPGDMQAVQAIAADVRGVVVCGLTRAVRTDIDKAWEALKRAESPRIHTGIATSPIHMQYKLRKSPDQVLEMAVDAVSYAKRYVSDVEFYAEDATRSDLEFLKRVVSAVIKAGATVINIPDTVGYATPWQFEEMILRLRQEVPELDRVTISVHCHNDLGMATANTLAGIRAGATQVEGTINGIGERAGNAALEEVIMAVYAHRGAYDVRLDVNTREIGTTSRLVAERTGVPVPNYKPVVGANAYSHASGIHQDGVLKKPDTYEIMRPETIGMGRSKIVLTSRSGRHALRARLQQLGYDVQADRLDTLYERFLELADARGLVDDGDLVQLVQGV